VVFEADGGTATIQLARFVLPSIVLLDLTLPDIDAFALMACFHCHLPNVVIVATADFLSGELLPAALRLGVHDVFDKKTSNERFLGKLRRLLDRPACRLHSIAMHRIELDFQDEK
jgi:DNA-binding NarL/FixJ family response regulator